MEPNIAYYNANKCKFIALAVSNHNHNRNQNHTVLNIAHDRKSLSRCVSRIQIMVVRYQMKMITKVCENKISFSR